MCALCEEGAAGGVQRDAFFQLKMNSAGFPKAEIYNELKNSPGGTSIVLKATDPQTNTKLIAIGYKYNSKKVLYFVGNDGAGSTVAGDAYQMRFADLHGNVSYRSVPRPAVISDFFAESNCVDAHNQLRQHALHLEKKWVTTQPYFRLHTTLVGINVVDTYRLSQFHSILSSNQAVND